MASGAVSQDWVSHKQDFAALQVLVQPQPFLLARLPSHAPLPPSVSLKLLHVAAPPSNARAGESANPSAYMHTLTRTERETSILLSVSHAHDSSATSSSAYESAYEELRTALYADFLRVASTDSSVPAPKPSEAKGRQTLPQGYAIEGPWTALRIRGPMEFALVGVMHIFTGALVKAGVSIFAISTWDTDYILVKSENTQHATAALRADGWTVLQGAELGEELPTEVGQAM